jgi:hypothetical protein
MIPKPCFHAEYNADIFHVLPALCWMRVVDEDEKSAGTVVQVLWLNFTAQWHWE